MTLGDWVEKGGNLRELSNTTGISLATLRRVARGLYLDKWSIACLIQKHTGGAVTALECVRNPDET